MSLVPFHRSECAYRVDAAIASHVRRIRRGRTNGRGVRRDTSETSEEDAKGTSIIRRRRGVTKITYLISITKWRTRRQLQDNLRWWDENLQIWMKWGTRVFKTIGRTDVRAPKLEWRSGDAVVADVHPDGVRPFRLRRGSVFDPEGCESGGTLVEGVRGEFFAWFRDFRDGGELGSKAAGCDYRAGCGERWVLRGWERDGGVPCYSL